MLLVEGADAVVDPGAVVIHAADAAAADGAVVRAGRLVAAVARVAPAGPEVGLPAVALPVVPRPDWQAQCTKQTA